jgi:putative ABC transport system permease protein
MLFLLQDLRVGARLLRKAPGITLASVIALALGIGLTATMFSIVYGAIMRGLPFEDGDRIVAVDRANVSRGITQMSTPWHEYVDWRDQQRAFSEFGAHYSGTINIADGDRPERFDGAFITASALRLTRVQPLLGRLFADEDGRPGAPAVLLLGYDTWRNRYDGDPAVLGRTVRANGEPAVIIGVMPRGFRFPVDEDMWLPLRMDGTRFGRTEGIWLSVIGRLAPGVSIAAANVEMNGIAARLATEHPDTNEGVSAVVMPYTERFIGKEPQALLYTMLGAVFLVLLVACANVANLLLSRAAMRSREVGVRTALGASRGRVVLQFLAEAYVLAVVGGLVGIGVALAGVRIFNNAIESTNPPFWIDIRVDAPIVLFVLAVTFVASLAAGVLPAWKAARADVNEILKDEARGSSSFSMGRLSRGLVVLEIALSCGLLVGAGLMIKSVVKLRTLDFGFPTATVFTARIGLPETGYGEADQQRRFFDELLPRLQQSAGAQSVGLTSVLPGLGSPTQAVSIDGATYADPDRDRPMTRRIVVSPGFFETFQLPLRQGRDFGSQDQAGALPVAIVDEGFARRHFGGESPLGRRIRFGRIDDPDSIAPWRTIVGLVPDTHIDGLGNSEVRETVYLPLAQNPARFMSIAARTGAQPLALTPQVRDIVAGVDPDIPLYFVNTLAGAIADNTWFYRVFGSLFMIFGFVALLLSAMGLYAVMSFSVSRRTREVGVRMALGARSGDVIRLIFRQALTQIGIGLVLGLALAAAVSGLMATALFEVHPRDPAIFGTIVLVLTLTGAAAALLPARRAARVAPQVALRAE